MKVDKVEINLIRGSHVVNTIEIEPEDINIINESLKIAYSTLSKKCVECATDGFKWLGDALVPYIEKIKELIGKIHD